MINVVCPITVGPTKTGSANNFIGDISKLDEDINSSIFSYFEIYFKNLYTCEITGKYEQLWKYFSYYTRLTYDTYLIASMRNVYGLVQ